MYLTDRAARRIVKAGLWVCGIALGLCLLAGAVDAVMESVLDLKDWQTWEWQSNL